MKFSKKINGEDNLDFDMLNKLGKHFQMSKEAEEEESTKETETKSSVTPQANQIPVIHADPYNHVSYSFSFFLHGNSRVCTSVDMKLHRPIRLLNTNDLFKLKTRMSRQFSTPANSTSNLPSSLLFNSNQNSNSRMKFKG